MSHKAKLNESRILLVDDEPNILRSLSRILKDFQVTTFDCGAEALLAGQEIPFDLVISDYRMPGMNGVEFLTFFKTVQPDAIRMILTGHADLKNIQHAINDAEVFRFITKPWNPTEILNAVTRGLEYRKVLLENRALANEVRQQRCMLAEKEALLNSLEAAEPGITKVNWGTGGSIIIDPGEYD
jgi:Response regulator containing CheY-like receiver, AAA-type ATPase, and DNA-binding domains